MTVWVVPLLLVVSHVVLVDAFFRDQARWTCARLLAITLLLLGIALAFSLIWNTVAYGAAVLLGEFATLGVLRLLSQIPGLERDIVLTAPGRAHSRRGVWGRFGILFLIAIGFELIFMIVILRGDSSLRTSRSTIRSFSSVMSSSRGSCWRCSSPPRGRSSQVVSAPGSPIRSSSRPSGSRCCC